MSKPTPKAIYYFCDETSIHDSFMAVGGLAIPDINLRPITEALRRINERCKVYYEVKWETTRDRRDCGQTAYAEYLAALVKESKAHFHIRFAPFDDYDHRVSGPNKRTDTTSKMFYQLVLHRAYRFYGQKYPVHLRPDGGDCTKQLTEFRPQLAYHAETKYGVPERNIASIQCRDSVNEPLLQLLDVTLGALTALRNARALKPNGPKETLARRVYEWHSRPALAGNTPSDVRNFSIWNAVPKWKKQS